MPRRSTSKLPPLERVTEALEEKEEKEEKEEATPEVKMHPPADSLPVITVDGKMPTRKISGGSNSGLDVRPRGKSLDGLSTRRLSGFSETSLLARRRSRPLFATFGKRVSTMVKVRMAFSKKNKLEDVFEKDEEKMAAIHEMPRQPRFSSFLSPQAQYAMMKGYEDKLHSQLVSSHPEYRNLLKRNQTPLHLTGIRRRRYGNHASERLARTVEADENADDDGEGVGADNDADEGSRVIARGENRFGGGFTGDDDEEDELPGEPEAVRPRMVMSLARTPSVARGINHLPPVVSRDRRLVLTYRMESAMDILDTLRSKKGNYVISPRVLKKSRVIVPVKEYHSWMTVWSKEFTTKVNI